MGMPNCFGGIFAFLVKLLLFWWNCSFLDWIIASGWNNYFFGLVNCFVYYSSFWFRMKIIIDEVQRPLHQCLYFNSNYLIMSIKYVYFPVSLDVDFKNVAIKNCKFEAIDHSDFHWNDWSCSYLCVLNEMREENLRIEATSEEIEIASDDHIQSHIFDH